MKKLLVWMCSLYLLLIPSGAFCACTSNGDGTFTTDGNESADVAECIADASAGDTIYVIAGDGAATWTPFTLSKSVKLIGPGKDGGGNYYLDITWAGTSAVITASVDDFRISGFSFGTSSSQVAIDVSNASGWRIDHNRYYNSHASGIATFVRTNTAVSNGVMKGVIDNNYIYFAWVLINNTSIGLEAGGYIWNGDLGLGTDDAVYVEDNIFACPQISSTSSIDANRGAKYVFRYNTVTEGHSAAHSLQDASERGTRKWEIYGNKYNSTSTYTYAANYLRAGTGVIFYNNYASDVDYNYPILFDNVRSLWEENSPNPGDHTSTTDGSGVCDGDHTWDGNIEGGQGYPCRDQIGRSTDATLWTDGSSPSPAQALVPVYIWSVYKGVSPVSVYVSESGRVAAHIQANRDFYDYIPSFDGTSGTGCGTLASRPATCTTGVGYWATDQSCSNLAGLVGDFTQRTDGTDTYLQGTLYKCTSANTWTAYYTPYTYPHPLRDDGGTPDTTPPVISTPLPSGAQSCTSNPRNVTISVTTDEAATCKYGTSDVAYASLPNTFSTTGSTSHSQSVSNACGASYTYYVRCQDGSGNPTLTSTAISYSVAAAGLVKYLPWIKD